MQRDCRMCGTEKRDAVDEWTEVDFFLRRKSRGRRGSNPNSSSLPFPVSHPILIVRLVFFLLPASFLSFFLLAVRCLRLTSRVTSCQKGFASRRMTAGGWYVAFSCDVSPIVKEKGLAAMVMAEMGGKERNGVDSPPWEACLDAAPEGLSVTNDRGAMHTQTDRRREKKERKVFIWNSLIRFSRLLNSVMWTSKK